MVKTTNSSNQMKTQPLRVRQTAFWAAATLTGANIVYLTGFAFYIAAGFAGLPQPITRLLASLSVFFGAPALVILFAALAAQAAPQVNSPARQSILFAGLFTGLAIANRIPQILILAGKGNLGVFDLYVPGSPAQLVEFIAFGPFQGTALLFGARLFPTGGLGGWARRLFALAGIFTLTGGMAFILLQMAAANLGIPPVVGLLICLPAWVILYPAATAVTACSVYPQVSRLEAVSPP